MYGGDDGDVYMTGFAKVSENVRVCVDGDTQ